MINDHNVSDLTLADLLRHFWQAKFYMVAGSVLTLIGATVFLFIVTPTYKASMIVAPADGYALGDYASRIENDSIASIPFWRPKEQEGVSTDFYRFIHTIRGPSVAEILLSDSGVLSGIKNSGHSDAIKKKESLAEYLDRKIKIEPLGATPLRRISYSHPDPDFATALLRKIHLVADQMIRRDRRRQSQNRIDYLKQALDRTDNLEHRKVITNLLMQQEHIQMLANLNEDYAAIVVEPAFSTPEANWPNHYAVWFLSALIGMFLGYVAWSFQANKKA